MSNAYRMKPGVKLTGEIVAWEFSLAKSYVAVREALKNRFFDEKTARTLPTRHAFTRALKRLERDRLVRPLMEDDRRVVFQLTREFKETGQVKFNYVFEATLELDKLHGTVTSTDDEALAKDLELRVAENCALRTTGDLSSMMKTIFTRQADLFPVKHTGGVYFVPECHRDFTDRAEAVVRDLGGSMTRFPVPEGEVPSVKESVSSGIDSMIRELQLAVEEFNGSTRECTIERAAKRVNELNTKIDAYGSYLEEKASKLKATLVSVSSLIRSNTLDEVGV